MVTLIPAGPESKSQPPRSPDSGPRYPYAYDSQTLPWTNLRPHGAGPTNYSGGIYLGIEPWLALLLWCRLVVGP